MCIYVLKTYIDTKHNLNLMVVGICHCLINPGDYFVELNVLNQIIFKKVRLYFVQSSVTCLSWCVFSLMFSYGIERLI